MNVPPQNAAVSKAKAKTFTAANRCIYCPDGKPPFTREHIVPQGLGGGLIFPKSSCEKCRRVTHEIETYCLRGILLSHRLGTGLVQHLDQLANGIRLTFRRDDGTHERRTIPLEEFPNYLVLPQIHGAPGMLARMPPGRPFGVSFNIWGIEEELRKLHQTGNAMIVDNFDLMKFARVLAKIAHSLVAADIRIENFDPHLLDLIHGRAPELAAYLIGEWPANPPPEETHALHQVSIHSERWGVRWLIAARIRLFAAQQFSPIYKVIVGELIETPEIQARFGLAALRANS
jgi:hypothetical protein